MRFDRSTGRVFVRQSWLNDMVLCPERARLGIVNPHMRSSTDATIMGTAVHLGIETILSTEGTTPDDVKSVALQEFARLQGSPYKQTNIKAEHYENYIVSMVDAFCGEILPTVQLGGWTEHKFCYPLGITVNDWAVWCEGTMDYVQPDGTVWDWKTSSRPYNAREKQSTSIQSTVYAGAVVHAEYADFPVRFRYGVMVRNLSPKSQIVDVRRTEAHMRWLRHTVTPAIHVAIGVGLENNWIMNDTNNLCSERWCSYWPICKGAMLSPQDLEVPVSGDIQNHLL